MRLTHATALPADPSTPTPTPAAATAWTAISDILTQRTGQTFFNHSGTRSPRPTCAFADRWVIDTTTLARLGPSGLRRGAGVGDTWGDTEAAF